MPLYSRLILLITLLVGLAFALTVDTDHTTPGLFADEAVYIGMTQSLRNDFDLLYTRDDLRQLFIHYPAGPTGIILRQSASSDQIFFSKPFTYSAIAVPFYSLFGINGFFVLNVLAWWICLFCISRAWNHELRGVLFGLLTLLISGFSPYTVWIHPEIFTAMLIATGMLTWRQASESTDTQRGRFLIGIMALCFTVAATIKPQLLIFPAVASLQFLTHRNYRSTTRLVVVSVAVVLLFFLLSMSFTGSPNAYAGNRKIFINQFPFEDSAAKFSHFGDSWSTENAKMYFQSSVITWNVFFFLIGRFTGIIPYFFSASIAVLLLLLPRYRHSISFLTLAAVSIVCIVQIVMIPTNYHGGGGALGNRYFMLLIPSILISIAKPPSWRFILPVAVISALLAGPFLLRVFSASFHPGDHAQTGIYRLLPAEWTLVDSLPIFESSHNQVVYDGIDASFVFLDQNSFGKEVDGFWIRGNSRSDFFLKSPKELDRVVFRIGQPLTDVRISIQHQATRDLIDCHPGELFDHEISVSGHPFIDIYGRKFWIYSFSIQVDGGAIPKYVVDSTDFRFLGAFVRPSILHSVQ